MSIIIQKIKAAIKPKAEITSKKSLNEFKEIQDAMKALEEKLTKLAKSDGYDDGYSDGSNTETEKLIPGVVGPEANDMPGVPGVKVDEQSPDGDAGKYDGGYSAPVEPQKAEDESKDDTDTDTEVDNDDDDEEECTCTACGSKYKMKKAKTKEEEDDEKTIPKKMDDSDSDDNQKKTGVIPENRQAHSYEFGNVIDTKKPEKVATSVNFNQIFGIPEMGINMNTTKAKMDAEIFKQMGDSTIQSILMKKVEELSKK